MTSLPSRYRRTLLTNYAVVGVQAVTTVIMTPVLVHGLGKTGYGVWSLALSFVLYLELLEFGFAKSTTRAVAHYEALGDRDAARRTITTSVVMLGAPALVALAGGLVLAVAFPALFDLEPAQADVARIICVLFAVDLALSIPSDTYGATLAGLHRFDLLNATLIATTVSQAVAWWVVLEMGGGLVALAGVTVALGLAGQLARVLVACRLIGDLLPSRRRFDRRMVKPLAGASIWFFVIDFAQVVVSRIDTVVVGLVVGVPEAAVYAVAQKLSLLAERVVRPATVNFFPQSAALSARAEAGALQAAVTAGTRISLGIAWPLCLTLALLAEPAIRAWVGSEFSDAAPVVVFLVAAVAVKAVTRTGVLALQGMGNARYPASASAGEAVLNLVLSLALAHAIGLQGVALATLVAAGIAELTVALPYFCRKLELPLGSFLQSVLKAHFAPLVVAFVVGISIRDHARGIVGVVAAAMAIFGSYLIVFVFTGITADERRALRRWARNPTVAATQVGG